MCKVVLVFSSLLLPVHQTSTCPNNSDLHWTNFRQARKGIKPRILHAAVAQCRLWCTVLSFVHRHILMVSNGLWMVMLATVWKRTAYARSCCGSLGRPSEIPIWAVLSKSFEVIYVSQSYNYQNHILYVFFSQISISFVSISI